MQDRVPLYPGRVTMTPVDGQANTYDMARADQPTQEGTPLNKATLLKDYTCSLLGLPTTAVPDDAFLALLIGVGTFGYRVKVQLSDGTPVEGATMSGISALTGSTLTTGADGIVLGKSTSKTVTISCTSPYIDQAAPVSQSVTATGTITDVTLTLISITDMITVTSSKTTKVSPMAKTMDVTAVGGGGSGGGSTSQYNHSTGTGGGGGGSINTVLNVSLSKLKPVNISLIIGAGGPKNSMTTSVNDETKYYGNDGGTTSVTIDGTTKIVEAPGGGGGKTSFIRATPSVGGTSLNGGAGGNGGYGDSSSTQSGKDGTSSNMYIFDEPSFGLAGGGGGGGGGYNSRRIRPIGGKPYGGYGAVYDGTNIYDGASGTSFGGGGGGCHATYGGSAAGHSGCVYLRFHF